MVRPSHTGAAGRGDAASVLAAADLVHPAESVDGAIARMAAEISGRLRDADPIVMPVLLGGLFTAVRLGMHFDFVCEFDRVQVRRYGHAFEGGRLEWLVEPEIDVRGRTVLIVDDVLDRGITLDEVRRRLVGQGAAQVLSAVLVVKAIDRPGGTVADFAGLQCEDRFLFGCGMDYRGHWRGLPALYAVAGT